MLRVLLAVFVGDAWRRGLAMAAAAAVGCIAFARPAIATSTVRLDLAQIATAADRAFVGRVVAVRSGRDASGLPSTWVTFSVSEVIAGQLGQELTIKQIGVSEPLSDGTVFHFPGVPTYHVGDELAVFLSGDSASGFCSPIGLAQGQFPVVHRGGRTLVAMTPDTAAVVATATAQRRSATIRGTDVDLDDFLGVVRDLIAHPTRR